MKIAKKARKEWKNAEKDPQKEGHSRSSDLAKANPPKKGGRHRLDL
jgi:hypothetical protein